MREDGAYPATSCVLVQQPTATSALDTGCDGLGNVCIIDDGPGSRALMTCRGIGGVSVRWTIMRGLVKTTNRVHHPTHRHIKCQVLLPKERLSSCLAWFMLRYRKGDDNHCKRRMRCARVGGTHEGTNGPLDSQAGFLISYFFLEKQMNKAT